MRLLDLYLFIPLLAGLEVRNLATKLTTSYGLVCEDNAMIAAAGTSCKTIARNWGLLSLGCEKMLTDLPTDTSSLPADATGARIADACPETCGLCVECSTGCAKWFIGNSLCDPLCNVAACQYDGGDCWSTDCQLGLWAAWSACSVTCGSTGVETRTRKIVNQPTNGGTACDATTDTRSGCNAAVVCPKTCVVSDWGEWSTCSSSCGQGEQLRTRLRLQIPEGNNTCPNLSDARDCYVSTCTDDCQVESWQDWSCDISSCSATRKRSILVAPSGGGASCPEIWQEIDDCTGIADCQTLCSMSQWSTWTTCTATCDGGTATRTRSVLSAPSGVAISACGLTTETDDCNTSSCHVDCLLNDWLDWSACVADNNCGEGSRIRSRTVNRAKAGNGRDCDVLSQTATCEIGCVSSSCGVEQGTTEECDVSCGSGYQWTRRSVRVETGTCSTASLSARTYCQGSGLSCDSSICTAPSVPDSTTWTCSQSSASSCIGISNVPYTLSSTQTDNAQSCGYRTYVPNIPCVVPDCSVSSTCDYDTWSTWSTCPTSGCPNSNLTSTRTRDVSHIVSQTTDITCLDTFEATDCPFICERECQFTNWSTWSDCSVYCNGSGIQTRSRSIALEGTTCDDSDSNMRDQRTCDNGACAIDCVLSSWTTWSDCTSSCGQGTQTRSRTITTTPNELGVPCGSLSETVDCMGPGNCPVDCVLGNWSDWSVCTLTCGSGSQTRTRVPSIYPSNGGLACGDVSETQACGTKACSSIDCIVGEWSEWGSCNRSCGGGVKTRTRDIFNQPMTGGQACPSLSQTVSCNVSRCVGVACTDNSMITAMGITCTMLKALGCDLSLKTLAAQYNVAFPSDQPPETRVEDACPLTCNVCTECATNCQLRDIGNYVCDTACNNSACEYDDDDCDPTKTTTLPPDDWTSTTTQASTGSSGSGTTIGVVDPTKAPHTCGIEYTVVDGKCVKCGDDLNLQALISMNCTELTTYISCDAQMGGIATPSYGNSSDYIWQYCAGSCNKCVPVCSSACPQYFLGNGVCDPACNSATCSWDNGDCTDPTAVSCTDSTNVYSMGYECSTLVAYAKVIYGSSVGCSTPYINLVPNAPSWVTSSMTLMDACPMTCEACNNKNLVSFEQSSVYPTTYFNSTYMQCQDLSVIFSIAGQRSCSAVASLLSNGCNERLVDAGIPVPSPFTANITLRSVCPMTCGDCEPSCSSGCNTWMRGNGYCDPDCAVLSCLFDNGDCDGLTTIPTTSTTTRASAVPSTMVNGVVRYCQDTPLLLERLLRSCASMVASFGGCGLSMQSYYSRFSDAFSINDTLADYCPQTCGLCTQTCGIGCPDYFRGNGYCDLACHTSECSYDLGDCLTVTSTGEKVCLDSPTVANAGYNCAELVVYGPSGCATDFGNLALAASVAIPEFPIYDRIRDACPQTCNTCGVITNNTQACTDYSSTLASYGTSCAIMTVSAQAYWGCDTRLTTLNSAMSAFASTATVGSVCGASCGLCGIVASCSDGYKNGDEEWIDCGGSCTRECSACPSSSLKSLGQAYSISSVSGSGSWAHNSVWKVACAAGATVVGTLSSNELRCMDGVLQPNQVVCSLPVTTVYSATGAISSGDATLLDTSFLPILHSALLSTLDITSSEKLYITAFITPATSGSQLAASSCDDSADLASAGLPCSELRAASGSCSIAIGPLVSAMGRVQPSTISSGTLLSTACPATCLVCSTTLTSGRRLATSVAANPSGISFAFLVTSTENIVNRVASYNLPSRLKAAIVSEANTTSISVLDSDSTSLYARDADANAFDVAVSSVSQSTATTSTIVDLYDPDASSAQTNSQSLLDATSPFVPPSPPVIPFECGGVTSKGCCSFKTRIDNFLSTSCGRLLWAGRMSKAMVSAFCASPINDGSGGSTTCSGMLREIHRSLSASAVSLSANDAIGCEVLHDLNLLAANICNQDPTTNAYCLLNMPISLPTIKSGIQGLLNREAEFGTVICPLDGCFRSNVRVYDASFRLSLGTDAARLYAQQTLAANWGSIVTNPLVEAVCAPVGGSYCSSSVLEIYSAKTPIGALSLASAASTTKTKCLSSCLAVKTNLLGAAVEYIGRRFLSPYHITLGVALATITEKACGQSSSTAICAQTMLTSSAVLSANDTLLSASDDNDSLGESATIQATAATTCNSTLTGCYGWMRGDGACDAACYSEICGWDGGDCTFSKSFNSVYKAVNVPLQYIRDSSCLPLMNSATSALQSFTCSTAVSKTTGTVSTCKSLYASAFGLSGCCVAASVDILRELRAEAIREKTLSGRGWLATTGDWTIPFVEQKCGITMDRTCDKGFARTVMKLNVKLNGPAYTLVSSASSTLQQSFRNNVMQAVRSTMGVSPADVTRVNINQGSVDLEVQLDPGRSTIDSISSICKDSSTPSHLSSAVENAAASVPGFVSSTAYTFTSSLPGPLPVRNVTITTSSVSSSSAPALPYTGALGLAAYSSATLAAEPCSAADLTTLGSNLTISGGSSFVSGATRTIECASNYTVALGASPSTATCTNGLWSIANNLRCLMSCSATVPTGSIDNTTVSITVGSLSNGSTATVACASGLSPSLTSTNLATGTQLVTCKSGTWSTITIDCHKTCNPPSGSISLSSTQVTDAGIMGTVYRHGSVRSAVCSLDSKTTDITCKDGVWAPKSSWLCSTSDSKSDSETGADADGSGGKKSFMSSAGGICLIIVIVLAVLAGIGFVAWRFYKKKRDGKNIEVVGHDNLARMTNGKIIKNDRNQRQDEVTEVTEMEITESNITSAFGGARAGRENRNRTRNNNHQERSRQNSRNESRNESRNNSNNRENDPVVSSSRRQTRNHSDRPTQQSRRQSSRQGRAGRREAPTEVTTTSTEITDSRYTDSQYTGSQYTDSQYTGSKVTDSQYTDSRYTDSRYTGNQTDTSYTLNTSSQYTDSRYTDSRYTDSQYTDSQYTGSKVTDSQYTDSRYTGSKVTDSQYTDSRYTDSQYTDSQYTDRGHRK